MFKYISTAIKNKSITNKLLFTLFFIALFRLGTSLPVPGIDTKIIGNMVKNNGLLSLYNMFSGGAFSNFTILALGIGPYITASIVIQLLTAGFETLKELQKSGEEGKKLINTYTRYLTLFLSIVQALGITLGIIKSALKVNNSFFIATVVITLVAGSMVTMWMADKITEKGLGNGSSNLIFVGIVSRLPVDGINIYNKFKIGTINQSGLIFFIAIVFITIIGVTFISEAVRKIPVEYAKAKSTRVERSQDNDHLPLKVNQSGVMPIIFASSLLALPQTMALLGGNGMQELINNLFNTATHQGFWTYRGLEILLIILFSYFYNTISFNVDDITKNMKQAAGFIPGIRPGESTKKYLSLILRRLTIVGALFLGLMALTPALVSHYMNIPMSLGGTSLLIIVGVALEIKRNLKSNLVMKTYKSFLDI